MLKTKNLLLYRHLQLITYYTSVGSAIERPKIIKYINGATSQIKLAVGDIKIKLINGEKDCGEGER